MLSQTAEYALRAVLYLAQRGDPAGPVPVADIADNLGIPHNYLSKILHQLARTGVLTSLRGKAGGFRLAVPPERLALSVVITPFDRVEERRRCLLGRPQCSERTACTAHTRWKEVADTVAQFFRETTVAHLIGGRVALPV
jgi:Rrf2 family protein